MNLPNFATNIAIIDKTTNLVKNISWGFIYDNSWIQEDEYLIAINDLNVVAGDFYNKEEDAFYHNGEKVITHVEIESEMQIVINIITGIAQKDAEVVINDA